MLILDGSWGVMFQKRGLSEADYRGERFQDHAGQMKGNNDILCLTRPDIVGELHDAYFAAGADISETNTFSATSIGQGEYGRRRPPCATSTWPARGSPARSPTAGRRRSRTSRASWRARSGRCR